MSMCWMGLCAESSAICRCVSHNVKWARSSLYKEGEQFPARCSKAKQTTALAICHCVGHACDSYTMGAV
eukprot:7317677-Prymnesium_polylepis.2